MILGIDTSNYTTSVAVVSKEQQLLFDQRTVLRVEEGERGLQQSAAVFQHLQNLPGLLAAALSEYRGEITGVCYSAKPRSLVDSYMPVFRVGEGFAQTVAATLGVPLYASTHQEGHIMAGLWSAGYEPTGPFLAMHLSGGTTDLLMVEPVANGFKIETLGSSSDLHAGQFVDRIGVKLGLPFPAGPALEELAQGAWVEAEVNEGLTVTGLEDRGRESAIESSTNLDAGQVVNHPGQHPLITLPSSVSGYTISFSGPCSAAERAIDSGEDSGLVAFAVFRCIANSTEKVLKRAIAETGLKQILFVGGVASNQLIKTRLQRLTHPAIGAKLYFAEPRYSRDNAVGIGVLGHLFS